MVPTLNNFGEPFLALLSMAPISITSYSSSSLFSSALLSTQNQDIPKAPLSIKIIDPPWESTITSNVFLVNGTISDIANGVVEVFAHLYPLRSFGFKLANPMFEGNWSKWSIPIRVNSTGVYRILAHVIDNQGIQNWTEAKFFVPFFSELKGTQPLLSNVRPSANSTAYGENALSSQLRRIAIVIPTFTETAYSQPPFYTFYKKYESTPIKKS